MIAEQEIKYLEKIADKEPLVKKLLEAYNEFVSDPAEIFRNELAQTAIYLGKEMRDARQENILKGEDKTFERISVLMKEGERILAGLNRTTEAQDKILDKKKEKNKAVAI